MNWRQFSTRLGAAAVLAVLLVLTGCHGNIRTGPPVKGNAPANYDMVIGAYKKDNQFLLNGAVVSAPVLEAHFRYLQDQHELPATVLLEDSDKDKLDNSDLEEFAKLQSTFHFTGYVKHKGKLSLMRAVESTPGKK